MILYISPVFANGLGDLGSIPGRVIPKTLKMVLDTTLLNTQHYKARFKGKVEQSWEWSSALPYTLVQQLSKREPSGHPRLWSLTYLLQLNHAFNDKAENVCEKTYYETKSFNIDQARYLQNAISTHFQTRDKFTSGSRTYKLIALLKIVGQRLPQPLSL